MVKSNRGFTLVELLAALVILAILMLVAVPAVMNILTRNRANTYVEDAQKMISRAEYTFRGDAQIKRPAKGNCIMMSLRYLDSSEFEEPPNSGEYMKDHSFVIIKREDKGYSYYVRLIEEFNDNHRGILLHDSTDLYEMDAYDLVENAKTADLFYVPDYESNPSSVKSLVSGASCNQISAVYAPSLE